LPEILNIAARGSGMRAYLFILILTFIGATSALAQDADYVLEAKRQMCAENPHAPLDQRLRACNEVIDVHWYQGCFLARLYVGRSTALNERSDAQAARADLDSAMKAWRYVYRDIVNRAVDYTRDGKYDLAIADLNLVEDEWPGVPRTLANRARAYLGRGDIDAAHRDANAALALDAKDDLALAVSKYLANRPAGTSVAQDYDFAKSLDGEREFNPKCVYVH
jgi:tetratricopeptide (TPR) repeat protein